jgi:amino acid transporter
VLGLLYGELAAAFPDAGGCYPAFGRILGERFAFPYMLLMIMVTVTATALLAMGTADYIRVLVPSLPERPAAAACLALAGVLAALSVRTGARITGLFLAIELAALAMLTGTALWHPWHGLRALFHPQMLAGGTLRPTSGAELALAVSAGIYTCGGAIWALYFAEEMEDAEHRIGRVVAWLSPLAGALIALPLALTLLAAPNLPAMLAADAPLAAYLGQASGPLVAALVAGGVVLAVLNALVATIMGYSRLLYATARDGVWPGLAGRQLARIAPRTGPRWSQPGRCAGWRRRRCGLASGCC